MMAVQAVDAEMRRITDTVNGDVTELEPDAQEILEAYSLAEMELKAVYEELRRSSPNLPPYDSLVKEG